VEGDARYQAGWVCETALMRVVKYWDRAHLGSLVYTLAETVCSITLDSLLRLPGPNMIMNMK
jgi:hypothetical protein